MITSQEIQEWFEDFDELKKEQWSDYVMPIAPIYRQDYDEDNEILTLYVDSFGQYCFCVRADGVDEDIADYECLLGDIKLNKFTIDEYEVEEI